MRRSRTALALLLIGTLLAPAVILGKAFAFSYDVPVQERSPWPEMRRDSRNTASSPIRARYRGDTPWSFATARGIFSTPVIGGDGTVYVGSADRNLYALRPDGHLLWKFRTGGIIDAAGAIGRHEKALGSAPLTIGSGDERLYRLRTNPHLTRKQRVVWTFSRLCRPPGVSRSVGGRETSRSAQGARSTPATLEALPTQSIPTGPSAGPRRAASRSGPRPPSAREPRPATASGDRWTCTPSRWMGTDNSAGRHSHLAMSPRPRRSAPTAPSTWAPSTAASTHSTRIQVTSGGRSRRTPTSTAHRRSRPVREAKPPRYTSPRLTARSTRSTRPAGCSGATTPPIRFAPLRCWGASRGGRGQILYLGSSNGKLYALNASTGRRRWSFDTTPRNPALRDRNDLNGSPALGKHGVYIGGEHGRLWFVPYDYCLHQRSPRCDRRPRQEFGKNLDRMFYVTPGGTTIAKRRAIEVPPATVLATRLMVRGAGRTEDAALQPAPSDQLVSVKPRFPFTTQLSGDGHYLFIRPSGLLGANRDYRIRIQGDWRTGAAPGSEAGRVDTTLRFRTSPSRGRLPLGVGTRGTNAFSISRLAIPLPPLLPSVNQIGFDSYDMIAGTIAKTKPIHGTGGLLLWVVGARRDRHGVLRPDPAGNFQFPLSGRYRHRSLDLSSQGLSLQFSFGSVPLRLFDVRGRIGSDLALRPGSGLYSETTCSDVPNYSAQLRAAGVCNAQDTLAASGTLLTQRYGDRPANRRPPGVRLSALELTRPGIEVPGTAMATLALKRGTRYPASRHVGSIVLAGSNGQVVPLDYRDETKVSTDSKGNLRTIQLTIPAGTTLPSVVRAYAILDVFPLAVRELR